jgi:hypothetical protein
MSIFPQHREEAGEYFSNAGPPLTAIDIEGRAGNVGDDA